MINGHFILQGLWKCVVRTVGERHLLRNDMHILWVRPQNDLWLRKQTSISNKLSPFFLQSGAIFLFPITLEVVAPW